MQLYSRYEEASPWKEGLLGVGGLLMSQAPGVLASKLSKNYGGLLGFVGASISALIATLFAKDRGRSAQAVAAGSIAGAAMTGLRSLGFQTSSPFARDLLCLERALASAPKTEIPASVSPSSSASSPAAAPEAPVRKTLPPATDGSAKTLEVQVFINAEGHARFKDKTGKEYGYNEVSRNEQDSTAFLTEGEADLVDKDGRKWAFDTEGKLLLAGHSAGSVVVTSEAHKALPAAYLAEINASASSIPAKPKPTREVKAILKDGAVVFKDIAGKEYSYDDVDPGENNVAILKASGEILLDKDRILWAFDADGYIVLSGHAAYAMENPQGLEKAPLFQASGETSGLYEADTVGGIAEIESLGGMIEIDDVGGLSELGGQTELL